MYVQDILATESQSAVPFSGLILAYPVTFVAALALGTLSLLPEATKEHYTFVVSTFIAQAIWSLVGSRRKQLAPHSLKLATASIVVGYTAIILAPIIGSAQNVTFYNLFYDPLTCDAASPRSDSALYVAYWTFVVCALGYGVARIHVYMAPYIMSQVSPKQRYNALAAFAMLQALARLLARMYVAILGHFYPQLCDGCAYMHVCALNVALATIVLMLQWAMRGPFDIVLSRRPSRAEVQYGWMKGRVQTQDSCGTFIPVMGTHASIDNLKCPLIFTGSPPGEARHAALDSRQSDIQQEQKPSSDVIQSASVMPSTTTSPCSRSPAVQRYLQRSRIDILGLCLPFGLFYFLHVGFGTFRFLIAPPIRGWESPVRRNISFTIVELCHVISYGLCLLVMNFLAPKLALIYQSVIACFVWFGLGASLFSATHADVPPDPIQNYFGASLFYDCVFRLFCSGQRLTLLVVILEALHSRVRVKMFSYAFAASRVGGAVGLFASFYFFDHSSPSTILITSSCVMLMLVHVLRVATPSMKAPHSSLCDIDLRTAGRFESTFVGDLGYQCKSPPSKQVRGVQMVYSDDKRDQRQQRRPSSSNERHYPRRPSLRSRASAPSMAQIERKTIANFI